MNNAFRTLCALLLFALVTPMHAGEQAGAANNLAPLERFAGEWQIDAKWDGGQELHARAIYAWAFDKKIMTAKTFVRDGDKEYQRYESIMGWNPEKKSLFMISFAFDGSMSEVLIEKKEKDTLHIGWTPYTPGSPSNVRQALKFIDNNSFQWTVSVQDGGNWKQIMDGTWKRKAN